jgi:hypothetical protein
VDGEAKQINTMEQKLRMILLLDKKIQKKILQFLYFTSQILYFYKNRRNF